MHSSHPRRRPAILPALLVTLALAPRPAPAAAPALDPPPSEVVDEARRLVEAMKLAERGPYSRLRWYCKDGTVLPPVPYGCRDHGGGRQHGEYSPERQRLAQLGWSVGTVVAALDWEELWDAGRRHQRLRELPLERSLVEVDDGWVLRRALFYRGRIQVEDEEQVGRELLVRLLGRPEWLREEFLLAREAVRTLPHHGGSDRTREVRRLSQEIAERDRGFEPLRIKIHTSPGPADVAAVREWLQAARGRGAAAELLERGDRLLAGLEAIYGAGEAAALREAGRALGRQPRWPEVEPLLAEPPAGGGGSRTETAERRLARLASALALVREIVGSTADGAANLAWMDLSLALEREVVRTAFRLLESPGLTRRRLLAAAGSLLDAVYGSGLLSHRERDALTAPAERLTAAGPAAGGDYLAAVRELRRAGSWGLSTVRFTFAEPLVRYAALEPQAARFGDDLVRGSPLLPLSEVTARLAADADRLAGIAHRLFGETVGGVLALNPGVASGRLRVLPAGGGPPPERGDVVVLPQTVSELEPVAGILTLAEGNLLSHVQILARNLGIPNASLSPLLAGRLRRHDGEEVLLAVGSDGSVLLERLADLPAAVRALLAEAPAAGAATGGATGPGLIEAPAPDLGVRRPLPLAELEAGLAGRVVGPKAANLGELARLFPGRVEQALALPFGVFAEHVAAGPDSPKARLERAYTRHRAGQLDADGLAAEAEAVRAEVAALTLRPELRRTLEEMMGELFGPPGSYGVFVRSDTNVEDLPGFTGAGLNLTVPHVVDPAAQLAAIPRVWASAYAPRALAWRGAVLARPEEVYSSALLMKSVGADKSGVLVTADLATRGRGLTVATAWGVGGAVDGEAAETLVLRPDGSTLLVGEAKAAYRRRLAAAGGVEWVPAAAGQVLTVEERNEIRRLAREVTERMKPVLGADGRTLPWDVEFGFVGGKLTLFQVRPLVERGQRRADRVLETLLPAAGPPPATVDLDATPGGDR